MSTATISRVQAVWAVLHGVPDPEVPVLSLPELGIVRDVIDHDDSIEVVLTPTYSGCPATEAIADAVKQALADAGLGPARVSYRLAPAWTTDWIGPEAQAKLRAYGIAPPGGPAVIRLHPRKLNCPRCDSTHTERLSAFGSTACKAMYRCLDCREPFEHFKPL